MSDPHLILIADDDESILEYYRKIFSSTYGELDIFGDTGPKISASPDLRLFAQPIELVKQFSHFLKSGKRIPLCILDMRMPDQNGLQTALALRKLDTDVNIIICSAYSDITAEQLSESLDKRVYLVHKPFAPDEFRLLVQSIVREWEGRIQLKKSEERIRQIIEGTRVGTWEWNITTGETVFNERWAEILGYTLAELSPTNISTWSKLTHPDDMAVSENLLQRHFSGEIPYYNCECRMRHKNGSWVWIHDRGQVVDRTEEGTPLFMSGTHSDITERKTAAESVIKSEEQIRLLLNSTAEGIYGIDLEGKCTFINPSGIRMLGYRDQEQLLGRNIHALIHHSYGDGRPMPEDDCHIYRAYLTGNGTHRDDDLFWRADGTSFPVEYWSYPQNVNGIISGAVSTFIDISERKASEQKLLESESNFRSFFETIDDMIFIADHNGNIFHTNGAVPRKLGYTADELKSMHILAVHPANKRTEAEQIFGDMFAGRRDSCPLPLARKDGTAIPVETRIWFGKWNSVDCIFGVSKDLSKEQESLQKFNKIFDFNPTLLAISSLPDRRFSEVNQTFLTRTGYSRDDVIGKTAAELGLFVHSETQKKIENELEDNGAISNFPLQVRNRSGEILEGLFSGEIIENQGKRYFLTVMVDISELSHAQEALRISEERLSLALKATGEGVWDWDIRSGIVTHNTRWCEILELDTCIMSHPIDQFSERLHPDDRESVMGRVTSAFAPGARYESRHRMVCQNGRIIWVQDRGEVVLRSETGEPLRMVGSITDITAFMNDVNEPEP